ncbi:MAG: hypothetical protein ACM3MF_09420 [Anaerolineae bacterium]
MQQRKKIWERKRPVAVTIVAWGIVLLFMVRMYEIYQPLREADMLKNGIQGPLFTGLRLTPIGTALIVSASYLLQVLAGIIVLIGFLNVRRWAWVLLMAWTGLSLTISLIDYFYSQPNYVVMASDVIIAVALSQSDVQRIFGIRSPDEPPA